MQLSIFDTETSMPVYNKPLHKKIKHATHLQSKHITKEQTKVIQLKPEQSQIHKDDKSRNQTIESDPDLEVEELESINAKEMGDYAQYIPQVIVKGSKEHPTPLCESLAMSSIRLPKTNYKPNLPQEAIDSGILSAAQLEDIILAGNAHQHFIHDGKFRLGYMVGSGTGFGKGNAIAGIILDNFRQSRTKAVWISKNDKAHLNSLDYWKDVGGKRTDFIDHRKFKPSDKILANKGILVTTYGILRAGFSKHEEDGQITVEGRIKQIAEWLGNDFDGVIAFDESHVMANAIDEKGSRGIKKGSMVAQVGLTLQRILPKARIVYSSATGATEVQNLVYAERLGLYGPGTSFPDKKDFINEIKASGVTAMELVARDLKSLGLYTARSLSYEGVEYETITHMITDPQKELYDHLARAWQKVLQNISEAVEVNNTSKNAKAAAMSAFWSTHQRFFNLIILTIQFPAVAKDIQKHLDEGDAIIIQLTNTNEAQTKRALADAKGKDLNREISLESLDISPKSMLIEYLMNSFPIVQFEDYEDSDGNINQRPVLDRNGEAVYNLESVRHRDELINSIQEDLVIPQGPLDTFISTFGADNIAEVTGRTIRLVDKEDPVSGEITKIEQRRTPAHSKKEIKEFLNDERRILIFSEAGGTGGSFHADKRINNQRRRIHYVYQPGWRADVAVQGFGRSHRSNQVVPPLFKLCSTNINAQKRFLSSIARRLEQLGALTKGQRTTGGQGILDNSFNFESQYAKDALQLLYYDIQHTGLPISMDDLQSMMGLNLMTKIDGVEQINKDLIQDIKKFLNRILSLEIDIMNVLFAAFENKMNGLINQAKSSGNYDEGIMHIKAEETKLIEEIPIFKHERTGAEAILTTLQLRVKVPKRSWLHIFEKSTSSDFHGFFQQKNSKRIYAMFYAFSSTDPGGHTIKYFERLGISHQSMCDNMELEGQYDRIDNNTTEFIWKEEYNETPDTKNEVHSLIKGLLLPIWKKIPGDNIVNRYIDDEGKSHLGRFISQNHLPHVRTLFNLNNNLSISEIVRKLNQGCIIEMDNGMKLRSTSIQSIPSVEFTNVSSSLINQLQSYGLFIRIKNKILDLKSAHLPKQELLEKLPQIMQSLNISVTKYYSIDQKDVVSQQTTKARAYTTPAEVINDCTLNSKHLRLPNATLDRNLYLQVKKEIERIGGKWSGGNTQAFEFLFDPTEAFFQLKQRLN